MSEFLAYGEATWHSGINRDAIAFHTNITDHYKVYQNQQFQIFGITERLNRRKFFFLDLFSSPSDHVELWGTNTCQRSSFERDERHSRHQEFAAACRQRRIKRSFGERGAAQCYHIR